MAAVSLALAGCAALSSDPPKNASRRSITVELLALDLTSCARCVDSRAQLHEALAAVADELRHDSTSVVVRETVIRTAEDAERFRFVSSPTIRVDGHDIALETRESTCGDCAGLCGSESAIDCRVWVWRESEYLAAPKEMIVEAIRRAQREPRPVAAEPAVPYVLPENLRRFFAGSQGSPSCCASPVGCCAAPGSRD